jgi:hypothetical protein
MTRFAAFIPIAACLCVPCLFQAAGANAKGGSPGFHSFSRQSAAPALAQPSHSCDAFVWTQRHHFVRTTQICQSQLYLHVRDESFR